MGVREERLAKGQCPNCGEDAAPYYLCGRCRLGAKLGRVLRKAHAAGTVSKHPVEGDGRQVAWMKTDKLATLGVLYEGGRGDPKPGDKRLEPRLRGVPVDVEKELVNMLRGAERPVTEAEIYRAWGALRTNRKSNSPAQAMAAIIKAERKRAR